MGCREVEGHAGGVLDELVVMELGAIVGGDGLEAVGVLSDQLQGSEIGLFLGTCLELADQGDSGPALDQGDDAVEVVDADDGVDLPVSGFGAIIDDGGALNRLAGSVTVVPGGARLSSRQMVERRRPR
jgi:hypothetical protein